jgi:hypothetical protein
MRSEGNGGGWTFKRHPQAVAVIFFKKIFYKEKWIDSFVRLFSDEFLE